MQYCCVSFVCYKMKSVKHQLDYTHISIDLGYQTRSPFLNILDYYRMQMGFQIEILDPFSQGDTDE